MPSPFNQLFGSVDEAKTDPNTGATTDETSGALTGPEGGNDEPNQPKETGYVNFADVYNLNQDKGTEMAGKATKAVTEPLGDLKGYQPPKTGLMTPQADAPTASRAGPSNQVQAPLLQMTGHPASDILSTQLASDQNSPFGSLSNWGGTALPATPDVGDIPQGYINARTASAAEGVGDIPQGYTDARQASANAPLHTSPAVTNGDTTATEKVATPAEAQAAAIAGGAPTNADGTPFDGIWGEKSEIDALKTKTAADLEALKAKDATASETEAANQTKYDQAQTKLDSYKSDGGKALLGDNANVYDAAIMNQAGGRDAFAALNKQFGGYGDKYAARTLADKKVRKGNIDQMGDSLNALKNAKTSTEPVAAAAAADGDHVTPEWQDGTDWWSPTEKENPENPYTVDENSKASPPRILQFLSDDQAFRARDAADGGLEYTTSNAANRFVPGRGYPQDKALERIMSAWPTLTKEQRQEFKKLYTAVLGDNGHTDASERWLAAANGLPESTMDWGEQTGKQLSLKMQPGEAGGRFSANTRNRDPHYANPADLETVLLGKGFENPGGSLFKGDPAKGPLSLESYSRLMGIKPNYILWTLRNVSASDWKTMSTPSDMRTWLNKHPPPKGWKP